ncbi:MAG: hypothetical protein ROO71_09965 [Balneola sp.]
MMENKTSKTRKYTEESWHIEHDNAPIPLEAFGYPIKHAPIEEREKKLNLTEYFEKLYDKRKSVKFKSVEELNLEKYFYMPKMTNHFFYTTNNALAIYPVLCGRADFWNNERWVRISRENIAKLAGISTKSVDDGINKLINVHFKLENGEMPFLEKREWQDGKRRGYEYMPSFFKYGVDDLSPKKWNTKFFTFHTCIVTSGVWAGLSRKAKALYIAIRSKSFFDREAYNHIEQVWISSMEEIYDGAEVSEVGKKNYRMRKWDISNSTLKELFELARIPYRNTRQLIDELEDSGLLERVHSTESVFKVYLRPESALTNK